MSVSSKKARAKRRAEDLLGGPFPSIEVDDEHEGIWLMWNYHVAPHEVRVDFPLQPTVEQSCDPWLWVDGSDCGLSNSHVQIDAERRYGAMTRIHLMEQFAEEIRNERTRAQGITKLEQAATAAGLYGKREPRRPCTVINP